MQTLSRVLGAKHVLNPGGIKRFKPPVISGFKTCFAPLLYLVGFQAAAKCVEDVDGGEYQHAHRYARRPNFTYSGAGRFRCPEQFEVSNFANL